MWRTKGEGKPEGVPYKVEGIGQDKIPGTLDMGLIDIAFCYVPHAGEEYTSRLLLEDELILVSGHADQSAALDSSYIYVDHGDEFRRQHAEAFPEARPAPVTIAASDWAPEYLLRSDSKGYLPSRVATPSIASGRLHRRYHPLEAERPLRRSHPESGRRWRAQDQRRPGERHHAHRQPGPA